MHGVLTALERWASQRPQETAIRDADGRTHTWSAIELGVRRVHRWAAQQPVEQRWIRVAMPSGVLRSRKAAPSGCEATSR